MKQNHPFLYQDILFFNRLKALLAKAGIIITLMVCTASAVAVAQTGTVLGEVKDAESGETLIGATIILDGTSIGTVSDIDGRYILRNVPAGDHTIIYRYMGYKQEERDISLAAGDRLEVNVTFEMDLLMGVEVRITAAQRGQSRALTRQRQSVNIRSIISDEQIEAFGDNTITGALSRIPGMGHGGTNIRGVGAGASNITMDGQRMGATGGDRSVDLSTISADMVQELDVIKVITPNMDADALSGVINVSTRRPIGGERDLNIRLGGGFQDRYLNQAGTEQRFSLNYGDSPSDRFSFGFNFSYQRDPGGREGFTVNWATPRAFQALNPDHYQNYPGYLPDRLFDDDRVDGDVVSDYISSFQNQLEIDQRDRYGTGLQMTFQPTDRTTFHLQGMFNVQQRERSLYGFSYHPRIENYQSPYHTGNPSWGTGPDAPNQSTMRYSPRLDQSTTYQYTVQAGARHILDRMDMEYSLGWGHGRFYEDQYRFDFRTNSRHEFIFNFDDRWNPGVEIAPWSEINNPGRGDYPLNSIDHRIDNRINNDFKASIDFDVPYAYGRIKFGSSASLAFMEGAGERLDREYRSTISVASFALMDNATWNILERDQNAYHIPWMLDLQKGRDFYINQTPNFILDEEQWALSTETSTYTGGEHTFAAYAMSNMRIDWFTILGGARVEHTMTSYVGREGAISETGVFLGATDIESEQDYTNIFPNLQTVFHLGDMTNIRLAYSRSIGRPTFNQLNPYIMRNYSSRTIQQGNPRLRPMLSNNYDIMFEHYFMNVGQLSAGIFFKDMSDFVYSFTERIQESEDEPDAEFAGWQRTGFRNGESATVYGVEFAWQQHLEFLPGFLGYTSIYANYSYSQSIADLDRDFEEHEHGLGRLMDALGFGIDDDYRYVTPLAGQRPHVVNVGLEYNRKDFSSQVSYQWAAPSISSYGNPRLLPPGIGPDRSPNRVQFDQFNAAANDLSLTTRYWINTNFQIWGSAKNILNHRTISYYYDQEYYPLTSSLTGRRVTVGLRYRL